MIKAVIFGGTTEGRELCEFCSSRMIPALYCVTTQDGAHQAEALPGIDIHVGRLDTAEMTALLLRARPALVVDATHPYAQHAGKNIELACKESSTSLLRVSRKISRGDGYITFTGVDELLEWARGEQGNIFVAAGASYARAFTALPGYKDRVWLRILPSIDSLRTCLDLGYRPERIICMQGPFSQELNTAMLKAANARILVSKNSGNIGGFGEKIKAANSLGIKTAVLLEPRRETGVPLKEAYERIMELRG